MNGVTTDPLYSRQRIGAAALLLTTCIALYLCWQLTRPFLAAITWALALAVAGHPLHRRLEQWMRPNAAALLAVLAVAIILLAPGVFLVQKGLEEAGGAFGTIAENLQPSRLHETLGQYSLAGRLLGWLETRFDLAQELKGLAGAAASQTPAALTGSIQIVTQFCIMLVVLFYFFRDRFFLLQILGGVMPLSAEETGDLFRRISETIYATLYGNVVVKIVQGTLGGLMFWILGLPAPVPFGAAMALLALLPVAGTSLVWGPAAVWLFLHGSWIKAVILVAWGALVVSLIDNLLYPIVVARQIRFHTLGILFPVFGGLISFGIAGVVLGPVILACTVALVQVWRLRLAPEA
jgi:predicted PurR-regulated permease PerM